MHDDIFSSLIEVELANPEDFLKIIETLSRIGVASREEKRLAQTCHILHKKGHYYIVHFLEMFMIDGKGRHFTDEDKGRRNTIASLLEQWGLLKVLNPDMIKEPRASMRSIRVVPYAEKKDWVFVPKYRIGKK